MKLVFSGGGIKGFVYIGIIQQLRNLKYTFNEYHGCSIGSVFALLYLLNVPTKEILHYSKWIAMNTTFKTNLKTFLHYPFHIFSNQFLKDALIHFLNFKGFSENVNFKQLFNATGVLFSVYATELSENSKKCFNYINTPSTLVVDAILGSCAIPGIFPAVLNCVDGFLAYNFPYINNTNTDTISFYLKWKENTTNSQTLFSYFIKCLKTTKHHTISDTIVVDLPNQIEKNIIQHFKKTGRISYQDILRLVQCGLKIKID